MAEPPVYNKQSYWIKGVWQGSTIPNKKQGSTVHNFGVHNDIKYLSTLLPLSTGIKNSQGGNKISNV